MIDCLNWPSPSEFCSFGISHRTPAFLCLGCSDKRLTPTVCSQGPEKPRAAKISGGKCHDDDDFPV